MNDINKRDFIGGTGRTILHEAVINGNTNCVEAILQSKSNMNINRTSLLGRESALHLAVQNSERDIAFKLLYHGADPNIQNKIGSTPLHQVEKKSIASLLVTFGAKANIKDFTCKKQSPVESALERGMKKSGDLVQFLIKAEANLLSKNNREVHQKKVETKTSLEKEKKDHDGEISARWKRQSKLDYLSWRRGTVMTTKP
jgi:ankyrin repeat protein